MNKPHRDIDTTLSPKAKGVHEALSRRLKAMERQLSTIARTGGGLGCVEIERLSQDVCEMVSDARKIERDRPRENARALAAHRQIFDAEGALDLASLQLRERLHEAEIDPTGSILAALQVSQQAIASAEAIITGKMAS